MKGKILSVLFAVLLLAIALSGCFEEKQTVNKYPSAVIDLDAVLPILPGDEFYLCANSSSDQDGNITEYIWEFPDESISENKSFRYEYDDIGSYEISLLVIDNDGLTNKTTKTIDVVSIPIFNLSLSYYDIHIDVEGVLFFNISIIGTQYHSVRISDIGTHVDTLYEDNLTSSGGYVEGISGEYFDVDGDEQVSVGDYIHYEYNYTTTIGPGGIELNAHSFTYGFYYYTHKPLMPSLGEVIHYFP